ncbi:GTPase IMAP family member 7 [Electrophorus electricus]|uniref:AIG1-type G domain-containing protein n=1 Tax=Electrophorus electricus TaxID=8005 RepID=A0A4W4EY52_ELEEL|nr:GTPase IMAP family member 7 [Electrophorus electricus]
MEDTTAQSKAHGMEGEMEKSRLSDPVEEEGDLRLVLLGWAGTGKSSVGNTVLGCPVFETRCDTTSEKPVTMKCEKKCVTRAGRQLAVVDTPDWFYSECSPEEVRRQLAHCESLSAPGPHAFLLCVSVHQSNKLELQTLDALEKVYGRAAISKHTIILFTHTDKLPKDQTLEDHLSTERTDLQELVERCGDRYHVFGLGAEGEIGAKERDSVEKLMEKVDEMVKESGEEFYTLPPLFRMEGRAKERYGIEEWAERSEEEDLSIVRRKRGAEEEDSLTEEERIEEEAEGKTEDLEVEEDLSESPPAPPPPFLHWMWDTIVSWVLWLPSLVRGSTLIGSFVGMFIGGMFGGAMGATVGSVATEVGRRKKTQKTKSK